MGQMVKKKNCIPQKHWISSSNLADFPGKCKIMMFEQLLKDYFTSELKKCPEIRKRHEGF